MDAKELLKVVHPLGEEKTRGEEVESASVFVDTYGGRVQVQWDREAAATPLGQLPFFIDFLKTAELFNLWVEECPLMYGSNHAPEKVEVLGTLFFRCWRGTRGMRTLNRFVTTR
jgi:hypothetical protein